MSFMKSLTSAFLAGSLFAAPIMAQAAPAEIEQARAGSEVEGESLRGGLLLPLIALIVAALAVVLLTGGEEPVSP